MDSFLDGKDQQTPIIMGCLGNNAKTNLREKWEPRVVVERTLLHKVFILKMLDEEPDFEQKILRMEIFAPKQAGNEAYSSPSKIKCN